LALDDQKDQQKYQTQYGTWNDGQEEVRHQLTQTLP
jgi:hypothetical protein